MLSVIRGALGALILFFNWVFTPKGVKRETEIQAQVDAQTANLTFTNIKPAHFA